MAECTAIVNACMIRAAKLTSAGAPSSGAKKGVASKYSKQVVFDKNIKTGASFEETNACGENLVSVEEPDKIKGTNITLDLIVIDFEMLQILCGGRVFYNGSDPIGWDEPAFDDDPPSPVCFEVWSKAWDGDVHAVVAETTPAVAYHHQVVPFAKFTPRPYTLKNGITVYQVQGKGSSNPNITANGPFNDWPAPIAAAGGPRGSWADWYDDVIPTHACGAIAVPSGS